jgi:NADPH:quinone reductase-like Zn-dependent oxidoreductase
LKAVVRTKYGSPDLLRLQEIDKPEPKDNQVLIRVHAASVNPIDWHLLRGVPYLIRLLGFGIFKPKNQILGIDAAGRIEAIAKDVTQFKIGDDVYGAAIGSFAEYSCARETRLAMKPANLTFEEAAAVPVAGLTALQALRDHGRIREGQCVLINGASGGVGTFAVQIAKAFGAHVTGVCSGKNLEMVRSLGADEVSDYTKEDIWTSGREYDLIVDNAAFQPTRKSLQALKTGGIYVGVGGTSSSISALKSIIFSPLLAKMKGRKVVSFLADVNQADLIILNKLFEAEKVVPVFDRKYSLSETAEAIRYVEKGHARGKVIITI